MIPTFTLPLGFLALLAVPILVGIYLLRTRSRRYPVSSLMLWVNQKQAREGGLRVERLQIPLLFLLELLALILPCSRGSRTNHPHHPRAKYH